MADILTTLRSLWTVSTTHVIPCLFTQGKELLPILLFYVVLGTVVFVVTKLPMIPDWLKVIACAGLLFFATDPRNVHHEPPEPIQLNHHGLLEMAWLWEVNIAQVRLERMLLFDYFIRGKASPIPWKQRPERFLENDQRAIGALQFSYTAKIGIDLKQVLVQQAGKTVYYWIPEPQQTGAVDLSEQWPIRTTLQYTTGKKFWDVSLDWRWRDEDMTNSALSFWEQVRADHYQDVLTTQHIDEQLVTVVRSEADRRLKVLLETLLDCRAVAVPKGQLSEAKTLGVLLPLLMQGKAMIEETSTGAES